ncbi:MAG: prolipoprotein diacylglyceryl transferase [Planctomycetota bacterium]|jgi:phosphatidylglycerol:prolipoprotein diacylglycerol transferase
MITHSIDPVITQVGPFYVWWYGLSYTAGFLGLFFGLKRNGFEREEIYDLTRRVATGVLVGGRLVEVVFYEWAYYGQHLWQIPAIWLGGMSTHGILLGGTLGLLFHCRKSGRPFLDLADTLAISAAFIMGMGRIGNFIDGQIVGSITTMPWGVKFPDADGYRHPVVLYDGLKNLALVPVLLWLRSRNPPRGVVLGWFLFGYGFLRIPIDFFREYRTDLFGFPPGQEFNLAMTIIGIWSVWLGHRRAIHAAPVTPPPPKGGMAWRRVALALLLFIPTLIPSDWTQDVPERYGHRHPGMAHSRIYPPVEGNGA